MNPNQPKSEQTGLNLPETSGEIPKVNGGPAKSELDYQIPQLTNSQAAPGRATSTPVISTVGTAPPQAQSQSAITTSNGQPPVQFPRVAADGDFMEKEWILHAKHIFIKNRNNPHEQSKEFNILKASYLKKRFNKDLKAADG